MNKKSSDRGIFISLFVATAAAMLGIGIIEPIMPLYAKSMGASAVMLGLIFSGFALSRAIFAPLLGRFSDQYGRKPLMVSGLILFIIFSICYILANTPLLLVVIRTAQGIASVMVTPIAQSYIGDITPEGKEGRYMNLFFISFFCGTALGPVAGGYLSDSFSLEAPFYAMALMAFISLLLVLCLVPKHVQKSGKAGDNQLSMIQAFKNIGKDRKMQGILTYIWSRGFYRWGFNSFFPLLATRVANLSRTQVGLALSGYMLAGAVFQYPSGVYADKFARYRGEFILSGGVLSAICMFIIPSMKDVYIIIGITLIMGIFSAFSRASAIAIRTERGRVHGMGAATGAFTTSMSLGQVIGPFLFGLTVDFFNIPYAFYMGGIIGLAGTVAAFWFLKIEKEKL